METLAAVSCNMHKPAVNQYAVLVHQRHKVGNCAQGNQRKPLLIFIGQSRIFLIKEQLEKAQEHIKLCDFL